MLNKRRREFITLLGGAAAWPLAARAQQPALPVVGFIDAGSAAERTAQVAAFRKGLAEGGYHVDQNVALEFHWAESQRRRQFITLLGGAAAAWPLAARAQQPAMPVIGYLNSTSRETESPFLAAVH